MRNLGGRLGWMFMEAGILVGEVVAVAMGVMVVMVVVAMRVMSSFEKCCLSVMEVKYLGIGFGLMEGNIFDLAGNFVAVVVEMEVDDLELEVEVVVRLAWSCLNGRLYFLS